MKSWKLEFMNLKRKMIKEINIEGENIIIDFTGAPFWKYYVEVVKKQYIEPGPLIQ